MFEPNPIWTQNGEWLQEDNTHIGFEMKERFSELLCHCTNLNLNLASNKEYVLLVREDIRNYLVAYVKDLCLDIERNDYKSKVLYY
ncbi:MAG: hypothetical protein AB6733_08190 [Clostridiaceae bacterium]